MQSTVKGLKRKREKKNKGMRHGLNFFFLYKKYQKMLKSKSVRYFCKDMPKSL
jgi:hypothetical protein